MSRSTDKDSITPDERTSEHEVQYTGEERTSEENVRVEEATSRRFSSATHPQFNRLLLVAGALQISNAAK